jgi:hypothetical protein
MTHKRQITALVLFATLALAGAGIAQRFRGFDEPSETRWGVPSWEVDQRFKQDVFTFARVQYSSDRDSARNFGDYGRGGGRRRGGGRFGGYTQVGPPDYLGSYGGGWGTDGPQSDLDFSFRLHQLTSLKVNPDPIVVRLDDEDLFDYPFIYMIEPYSGWLHFTEAEIAGLQRYLLNGGFLMVDDFWGQDAWDWVHDEFKRVFRDREPADLDIKHEIFRCVYHIKEFPQVPSYRSVDEGLLARGITWERGHGPGAETPHFRALLDDKGRIMVLFCHNTDLGDGWEREGTSEFYFHNFCENKSYPMGINIVTYAMTH